MNPAITAWLCGVPSSQADCLPKYNRALKVRAPGALMLILGETFGLTWCVLWWLDLSAQATHALTLLSGWLFIALAGALTMTDIRYRLLPDRLTLAMLWLGLLINTQCVFATPLSAIMGAAFGYVLLVGIEKGHLLITKKPGIGRGDAKLLAALGAFFGIGAIAPILLIAAISSLVGIAVQSILKNHSSLNGIAFGPHLLIGGMVMLFTSIT